MKFVQVKGEESTLLEWLPVPHDYDYLREVGRAAFADMLHDHDRNKKYEEGVTAAVRSVLESGEVPVVLDIGTGTGLLSIFAARAGAQHVYAIDSFEPMIRVARRVIERNGCSESITLIHARSTDLRELPGGHHRANILVTEVFDTELIGEGAIQTYNHARQFLLKPGYLAVPHIATIHLLLGTSPTITKFNTILSSDDNVPHPPDIAKQSQTCHGENSAHDIHAQAITDFKLTHQLTPFKFCFTEELPLTRSYPLPPRRHTSDDYTCGILYWTLEMIPDGDPLCVISCAPPQQPPSSAAVAAPFREHWIQAAYYIPPPPPPSSTTPPPLSPAPPQQMMITHDSWSYFFTDSGTPPCCSCPSRLHLHVPRNRLHQINSTDYASLARRIPLEFTRIIVVSDHSPLPAVIKRKTHPHAHVTNLSPNKHNLFWDDGDTSDDVIIANNRSDDVTEKTAVTFFSPYLTSSFTPTDDYDTIAKAVGDILLLSTTTAAGHGADVTLFPRRVRLVLLGITFVDRLDRIRSSPVKSTCGVDLTDFDLLLEPTLKELNEREAHPLHEYKYVTNNHTLITLDLFNESHHRFTAIGNALAFWINWDDDDEQVDEEDLIKPPPNRSHGIHFISQGQQEFTVNQTPSRLHIHPPPDAFTNT